MTDTERNEMIAALSNRPSLDQFIKVYFKAYCTDSVYCSSVKWAYVNDQGEGLNLCMATEFYDDFISSRLSLEKYIEQTTFKDVE